MTVEKTEQGYIIRLFQDEKVVETLTSFCGKEGIASGIFHGIGAVKNTEMGYYDLEKKEYFFKQYPDAMEVVSMTGNIALLSKKSFLHVHAVLSDTENAAYGGHVKEAVVAVTLEIFLTDYAVKVERRYDQAIGLNLWELKEHQTKDSV